MSSTSDIKNDFPSGSSPESISNTPTNPAPPSDSTSTTQPEPSSSSSSSASAPKPTPTCSTCTKSSDTLKDCPKCHSTTYCSKDCQKADFKAHKKVCAKMAQEYAKGADFKMAKRTVPSEGHRGGLQKWQFDT